jgi:hypothetical protein
LAETEQILAENQEATGGTKQSAEMRYPIDRQEDYGATVEFMVHRTESNLLGEDPKAVSAKNISGEGASIKPKALRTPDESTKVTLYLPAGLAFNDGVTYDNINIGAMGAAVEGFIKSGGDMAAAGDALMDILTGLTGGGGGGGKEVGKLAQSKLASTFGGEEIGGAVSGVLRVKANPHTRVLFGSVPIRTFEFGFTFLPSSLKEAETVIKIIKSFRTELYPMGIALVGETYNGYAYPDMYDIQFLYKGKEITDAPKLLPCYLQGVNSNYNPSQMAFFKDGKFTEITLSLSFTETRTLFRQDVIEGGY